jgi:hypothetical protein
MDRPWRHPQALGNLDRIAPLLPQGQYLLVAGLPRLLPGVLPTGDVRWRGRFPFGRWRRGGWFARGTRQCAAQVSHTAREDDIDVFHQVLHQVEPI